MLNLFFVAILITIRTYMHKLLINDIHSNEYLFLYSVALIIMSGYLCSKDATITNRIWKLSLLQYGVIIISALMSLYMAKVTFDIVKSNTVVTSNYIIKGLNLMMLVIIGKLLFNEELSNSKISGLVAIFVGIYLLK